MLVLSPPLRALISILLIATAASRASAQNLQILGVSGSQYWANESPQGETDSRIRLTISVKNTSASSVTIIATLSESCGPFTFSDGGCPGSMNRSTVGAGQTTSLFIDLVGNEGGGDAYLPITVWSIYTGGYSATANLHVVAGWWGYPVSVTMVSTTYTPHVTPRGGSASMNALTQSTAVFSVENTGSAAATYKLKQLCGAWTATCTISDTLLYVPSGGARNAFVYVQAGAIGNGGVVKVIATAPMEANGVVRVDTGSVSMTAVDWLPPSITFMPAAGQLENGEYEYWGTERYLWIYVDVCDWDGIVGNPSMSFNNNAIPYITIQPITKPGCNSAKRASYNVSVQSIPGQQYANVATITVSDGVHTVTGTQVFRYDDYADHRPTFTVPHPSITVQAGQTAVDTFRVTNPGWHTVTYNVGASCRYDNNNWCVASASVSSVSVGAGATVSIPVTFPTSTTAGNKTTVALTVTYTSVLSGAHSWADSVKATPLLMQAPTVTVTPANGTTVTSNTINLLVLWCDPDGALPTHTVVWQGQTLYDAYTPETRAGCVTAGRSTYNNLSINPWQQTVTATAIDAEGHSTTATNTITFSLPLSNFTPLVTPKNTWRVFARNVVVSDTFTVRNSGSYTAAYSLTASCGIIGPCTSNPSSITLAPGASGAAIVSYTSPATLGAGDDIKLVARYTSPVGGGIADTGIKHAIVPTVEATPVVEAPAATSMVTSAIMCCFTFRITNPGSAQVQMHVVTTATNGFSFQPISYSTDSILPIDPGATVSMYVPPKSPAAAGITGAFTVTASYVNTAGTTLMGSATGYVTTTAPVTVGVAVSPHSTSALRPAGTSLTYPFYITMTGNGSSAFSYTISCEGQSVSCSGTGTTATLSGANPTAAINASYVTASTNGLTGILKVVATSVANPAVKDSGMVTVNTAIVDNVTVDTRTLNPGIHVSRGACLTIAAGDGAAYECGDLRVVHPLPTTTTMNKARTPTLIYNSAHARTREVIAANVTIQPQIHPTTLQARLAITGLADPIVRDTVWNSSWNDGVTRRIAVMFDAQALNLATGAYHYELEVRALDGSTTIGQGKDTATIIVVNRARTGANAFGRGWWLDGLEQLVFAPTPNGNQILWVGGDGTGRLYSRVAGTNKFAVVPMVDGPDTLEQVPGGYRRWMQDSSYVHFNASGQHDSTVNRQRHATSFGYSADLLTSISLPVPNGGLARTYSFAYTSGVLTSVAAPGVTESRITTIGHVAGTDRISSITDPDGRSIQFGADASSGSITSRTDKRGFITSFSYDEGGKLRQSSLAMQGTGADVATTFCAAESRGIASCSLGLNLASVYTLLDGPRTDAGDTTKFFINRFGAPDTVVNALRYRTSIARSTTLPLLATSVTQPNGFSMLATYNTRGLIETQTAVSPFSGANAVTRYFWREGLPDLDSLSGPTGEKTRFHYNANGDRDWQEDGRGDSTRVYFTYNGNRQLAYIQPPGNSSVQRHHLEYDASLGNLRQTTSPLGSLTRFFTDAIGRVDSTESPIDGGLTRGHRIQFDVMDRVLIERDIGPAVQYSVPSASAPSTAPAVSLVVTSTYDNEGNPLSVVRHSEPSIALSSDLTTSWTYDGAGRKKTETGSSGTLQWSYDAAGNVTTATTKRNHGIVTSYDALNRPIRRITPQVTRDSVRGFQWTADCIKTPWFPYFNVGFELEWTGQICTPVALPHSLVIGRDSATFAYDAAGNLITANNADALITREYFPGGALKTEITRVSLLDTAGVPVGSRFNSHRYRLDYAYDLSGHRLSRLDSIPTCTGCVQTYTYLAATGALSTTTDAGAGVTAAQFGIAYDAANRIYRRTVNGVRSADHRYDADGRMDHRTVYNPTNGTSVIFDDGLDYDLAGRIISTTISSDLPGIADATTQVYNGLGALAAITRTMGSGLVDEYQTDAMGNRVKHHRWVAGERTTRSYSYGLEQLAQVSQAQTWSPGQEVPSAALQMIDTVYTTYVAGSVDNTFKGVAVLDQTGAPHWTPSVNGHEWTFNAYRADDRLAVTQRSYNDASGLRTVFSEYRYDALGRRITARTRWDAGCVQPAPACVSYLERTVWDGDQVLMELRTGAYGDAEYANGAFYGTVRNTHAGGIDEPLAVWKLGVGGTVPHLSWRGTYEAGTPLNGASGVSWPARGRDAFFASDLRTTQIEPSQWMGSLMDGKAEPSGLIYMRNRYYDPTTGRFTQEDPIGLAGGMNLYGFVGGDPVNHTDPFGLCPPGNTFCLFSGVFDLAMAKAKGAGQALKDLTPLGDSERSANAFASGRTGVGVAYGALAIVGVIPGGEEGIIGTKAAVRAGLGKLRLTDDVAKGVRGLLGAGRGEEWGVHAMEGGGAVVNRFVKGGDGKSSAIYTYLLDKSGNVRGMLQRGFDEAGRLLHFDPKK